MRLTIFLSTYVGKIFDNISLIGFKKNLFHPLITFLRYLYKILFKILFKTLKFKIQNLKFKI